MLPIPFHSSKNFCKEQILKANSSADLGFVGQGTASNISFVPDPPPTPVPPAPCTPMLLGETGVDLASEPVDLHIFNERISEISSHIGS